MARTKTTGTAPAEVAPLSPAFEADVQEAQRAEAAAQDSARSLAATLAYDGPVAIGTLEDEIRFYQRRSVEALLECGKRLLILKELTPHGEFMQRVELLGFAWRTAQRFMQAAAKVAKSATVAHLANEVKSSKAFLELVTHDNEDDVKTVAGLDDIDRMSAGELRAALREAAAEREATQEVLDKKNAKIDKLERQQKRINAEPPDERMAAIQAEAASMAADLQGRLQGMLRQAFIAVINSDDEGDRHSIFLAGLLGQLQARVTELRDEFDLPDLSTAADDEPGVDMAALAVLEARNLAQARR